MICFSYLIKIFRTWRIRTQIFFVQFMAFSFVIIIFGLCVGFNFVGTFEELKNFAQQQLILKFIYQSSNTQLQTYRDNLYKKIKRGINSIDNFNRVNQLIYKKNTTFSRYAERCQEGPYDDPTTAYHLNQYCYGMFDCSKEISTDRSTYLQEMVQLSTLMTSLATFQEWYELYFTLISSECYHSNYPGDAYKTYVPSERPWFQNQIQNGNSSKFVLSEPYINIFDGVYQTVTTYLLDRNQNPIGIGAIDLNFTNVYPKMKDDEQFLVINRFGNIIVSKLYNDNSSEVYSLFNESLFGFERQDVEKILAYSFGDDASCSISIPNTTCILNKNTGVQWYIRKKHLLSSNWLLIMFTSSQYKKYLDNLHTTLNETFINTGNFIALWLVLMAALFILSYILTFLILQKPIDKLINSYSRSLLQGRQIELNFFDKKASDQLDKLSEAFFRLASVSNHQKSEKNSKLVRSFNSLQYPRKQHGFSKLLNKESIKHTINQQYSTSLIQSFVNKFHTIFRKSMLN